MRTYNVECSVDGIRTVITVQTFTITDAQNIVKKMFYGSSVTIYFVR